MQKTWIVKRSGQPSNELGHGCIFQNPHGMIAADLIEQTGLKGARAGLAAVSERDANFIIAEPGATADDVQRLIELIRSRVSQTVGVELENQIQIW
jgi:UDP-N-acetylmuramate dehydrogenase